MPNKLMKKQETMPTLFQNWIDDPATQFPVTLGKILSPVKEELGKLTVVHPTDNDPVLISEKIGPVALWFKF
jgi:hypothetical protein